MNRPIGLQLYSINQHTAKDFKGSLERVAKLGYDTVEFAGYGGADVNTMNSWLNEYGLKAVSSHADINNLDFEIPYLNGIGAKILVCPAYQFSNREEVLKVSELFNTVGKRCYENGIIFAYHNHDFEFKKENDEYLLDILYNNTDPKYVKPQLDLYWVAYAGLDPVEYTKKYKDRIPALHIKEMKDYESRANTAVGQGVIDFKSIIDLCPNAELIIEQEAYDMDEWVSLKFGVEHLKSL